MVFSKELRNLSAGVLQRGKGGTHTHHNYFTSDADAIMGLEK